MTVSKAEIKALFELPFNQLLDRAHQVFKANFPQQKLQLATLCNIKTGACPEDCKYCSQSIHNQTEVEREKLMELDTVLDQAKAAKANGATRFCMGAAWRSPTNRNLDKVAEMVSEVKALGMETCVTLGMLKPGQAERLKAAGLDYYNHNLDTSPEYYSEIATTRTYQDRLDTLKAVRDADIKVCCGGILGLGETREDRISLLAQLASMLPPPESVPINQLVPVPGTPLAKNAKVDDIEFIRTIAVARIIMPKSYVRLSAGRESMSELMQATCFYAGANSCFYGDELLTCENQKPNEDMALYKKLGIETYGLQA